MRKCIEKIRIGDILVLSIDRYGFYSENINDICKVSIVGKTFTGLTFKSVQRTDWNGSFWTGLVNHLPIKIIKGKGVIKNNLV